MKNDKEKFKMIETFFNFKSSFLFLIFTFYIKIIKEFGI
jgi:hypothetical protein